MATYLVTQATGQQSQSVITHLLASGAKVHAVVRDPQKIPPILESPGVTIFKGESVNFEQIFEAAQGCQGVFLNTFPIPGLEAQQAKTVVEASKKAGVDTIVASTTLYTGTRSMWDDAVTEELGLRGYFLSKSEVEDAVRGAGFTAYTILRPAFIHFDFMLPSSSGNFPKLATHGELDHAYTDEARMLYTDANDIGGYATAAFQNPAKFAGQEIELGNENLTIKEVRDIVARVSDRNVQEKKRSPAEIEEAKTTLFGQRFHLWANVKDLSTVSKAAKEVQANFGMPFTSLEAALQRDRVRLLECLPV
ncbi:hypothetical protein G7Z17_g3917 [Cylindrodendrum hubeiense]|uniref:NmrA-like domain-containing protein n=1 Tax=Cylindrodendrum hubeiense TaxID=595255 RepID=A0A9P5LAD9_9HYPO|nr:hypothetical protein G7Z17_g3917 [Cylindrodendrum hubeiense]